MGADVFFLAFFFGGCCEEVGVLCREWYFLRFLDVLLLLSDDAALFEGVGDDDVSVVLHAIVATTSLMPVAVVMLGVADCCWKPAYWKPLHSMVLTNVRTCSWLSLDSCCTLELPLWVMLLVMSASSSAAIAGTYLLFFLDKIL